MTIETATYISSLNSSYPEGTSQKKDGDNHIRLIKATLLATFPNINAAMTASDEELNFLVGVTSAVQTQLDAKIDKTGETGMSGTFDFSGASITFPSSVALPGNPTTTTQAVGDNTTRIATTAFVVATSMTTNLPGQTGNGGLGIKTDGTTPAWGVTGAEALALQHMGIW